MPPLREAEARAAAALQRLVIARETLEQEETRAKNRMAELDQRLVQLAADIERERRLAADAEAALARFVAEEETPATRGGRQRRRSAATPTPASPRPTRCWPRPKRLSAN